MSKHTTPFRPKNVQYANFEMFGAVQNKRLPAITSAQKIQDSSIRDLFRQLSKKTTARIDAFNQLKVKIPQIQNKEDFLTVAEPCYAVFETSVSDYTPETRRLAIEMIAIILNIVVTKYKDQLSKAAKDVFPTLLLLFFDTEKSVLEKAKELLFEHFPTKEKRNAMISKLRDEISDRLRMLFNELEDAKWEQLDESQSNENWGRLASMALSLSTNLLITCRLSHDVFTSFNPPPILKWLKTEKNLFNPRTSPQMRAAAYVYISVIVQAGFLQLHGAIEVSSFIRAESSPLSQEKLIRLIIALLEKGKVKTNEIQTPIFESLYLFYQPQKAGLADVLERIKDKEFIEKCIIKSSQSTDINTANELFNCIFTTGGDLLSNDFLIDLFSKSVNINSNTDSSNHDFSANFFSQCSLQYFVKIQNDPTAIEILSKADEMRAAEFLSYCDKNRIEDWLKIKQNIKPETLTMIMKKAGTESIRQVWPNIKDIPLEEAKSTKSLVDFIKLFINSDEVEYIITNMPQCLPELLESWDKDITPFKTKELFNKAGELLDKDLKLIRILKQIFPDEPSLNQIANETTQNHLKKGSKDFDPLIFEFFTPSTELLDDIIFGDAISYVQPKDKALIPHLVKRINELIPKTDQIDLADIAAEFVKASQIDPISITASPLNYPLFCFNYWDIIGFDMMNLPDFCIMLECYLHKICPFMPAFLYTQNNEWQNNSNIFPDELLDFIENHKELAMIAHELSLSLTLASICFINNLDFSSFETIDSKVLLALPSIMPPPKEETNDENAEKKQVIIEDDLVKTIRCEWNMDVPSFPKEDDLRGAVCYLQHFLPVVEDFNQFTKLASTYINSNDTLEFFLSLRLLSMIYFANQPFDVKEVAFNILEQVDRFSPLPESIIKEVSNGFQVAKFLTPEQFNPFIFNCIKFIEKSNTSETVSKIIVPLISFFNAWELVDSCFDGKLDLSNIECWHFVTHALKEMPYKRRIDTIPLFTDSLPPLLNSLDIESKEFMMLITTFPSSAMKWITKVPNSIAQPLYKFMEKAGTTQVFKQMAETASKMKLDSTKITIDNQKKSIIAVYVEDATSVPVVLTISFPKVYPFKRIDVSCEFGDEGENCAYKVFAAIDGHQSIEAGIIAWHQFVTYRLREVEPCTICYSYLSEDMKKPTISCPTCGQKFHGKCIQKWFTQCLKPTCPYCGSPWDEKKREKSKK